MEILDLESLPKDHDGEFLIMGPNVDRLFKSGSESWNQFVHQYPKSIMNFEKTHFKNINFAGFVFPETVIFTEAIFEDLTVFSRAEFLGGVDFTKSEFRGPTHFSGATFYSAPQLQNVRFSGPLKFDNVKCKKTISFKESFFEKNVDHTTFAFSEISGLNNLPTAINYVSFKGAKLFDPNFSGCKLIKCDFVSAELVQANFDTNTVFESCNMKSCICQKSDLLHLDQNFGGLTVGQRREMKISDDISKLKSTFGGFWSTVHLISFIIFIFPYVWFVIKYWPESEFIYDDESYISLIQAFILNIWNGGRSLESGEWRFHWSAVIFALLLIYNSLRIVLLWKTKQLELDEKITGIPPIFSFSENYVWRKMYIGMQWLFWFSVALSVGNTMYFFTRQVSLSTLTG